MSTLITLLSIVFMLLMNVCMADKNYGHNGQNANLGDRLQCWKFNANQGEIGGYGKKEKCFGECCIKVSLRCRAFSVIRKLIIQIFLSIIIENSDKQ